MMRNRRLSVLCVMMFCLVFATGTGAQNFQVGGHFMLGIPQGEFSQNVDNAGLGLGGYFLARISSSPLYLGGQLGFLIYGNETRKEPFSTTIPDVTVNVETSNNIVLAHALARFQVPSGAFRPYIEGLIGLNYLFTTTTIKNENAPEQEIASSTNFEDIAFSYGMGGGAQIRVYQSKPRLKNGQTGKPSVVFIDLRLNYLSGGEAEYLKKGSIRREGADVAYDIKRSRTDLLTIQLGIAVSF